MIIEKHFFVILATMWKNLDPHKLIYSVALQSSVCFRTTECKSLLISKVQVLHDCQVISGHRAHSYAQNRLELHYAYKCCAYEKRYLINQRITGCTHPYDQLNLGSITQCLEGLVPLPVGKNLDSPLYYLSGGFHHQEAFVISVPTNF